jgi:hypothetical protein
MNTHSCGINFQDNNQFTNIIGGKYTVHVKKKDKNGCGHLEELPMMYPKYFTQW